MQVIFDLLHHILFPDASCKNCIICYAQRIEVRRAPVVEPAVSLLAGLFSHLAKVFALLWIRITVLKVLFWGQLVIPDSLLPHVAHVLYPFVPLIFCNLPKRICIPQNVVIRIPAVIATVTMGSFSLCNIITQRIAIFAMVITLRGFCSLLQLRVLWGLPRAQLRDSFDPFGFINLGVPVLIQI